MSRKSKSPKVRQSKPKTISLGQLRAEVAKLKKAGVTSPKTNPRKIKKTSYWLNRVKEFRSVINARETPVKISPSQKRTAKLNGVRTVGRFALIPKIKGQRVLKSKSAPLGFKVRYPSGVESITLPRKRKNETLSQYIERLKVRGIDFDRPGRQLAFTLFGNRSQLTFGNIDQLVKTLEESYGPESTAFRGFSLFSISNDEDFYNE